MVEEQKQAGRHIALHPLMCLVFKKNRQGIQGQWEPEFPTREYLEQVKCCHDTDCTERMMKKGFHRTERWKLGRIRKHLQETCESLGMGL